MRGRLRHRTTDLSLTDSKITESQGRLKNDMLIHIILLIISLNPQKGTKFIYHFVKCAFRLQLTKVKAFDAKLNNAKLYIEYSDSESVSATSEEMTPREARPKPVVATKLETKSEAKTEAKTVRLTNCSLVIH